MRTDNLKHWLANGIAVLAAASLMTGPMGCGGTGGDYQEFKSSDIKPADPDAHHGHHHHHGEEHEAPHGGTLVELGDHQYHAEIVWDEKAKTITVFLLDGEAKAAVPIAASELVLNIDTDGKETMHKLAAKPQDDDGDDGQSSRFVTTDTALFESFHDNDSTAGQINVKIKDKPFAIVVTHKEHDHDHDHGDHKEHDHAKDKKGEGK
ncbi:MAG: hypothetical protein VX669_16085 [Planctomycetota bacterium]|nr:hypothetical protein [Planctomycetota bacterium]